MEHIIDHRIKTNRKHSKTEYFVKWTGYSAEHCTWEPAEHLQNAPLVVDAYWQQVEAKQLAKVKKHQLAHKTNPDTALVKRPRIAHDR